MFKSTKESYVLNINTYCVHKGDCWHLKEAYKDNLIVFLNLENLKEYYNKIKRSHWHFCNDCIEEEDLYDLDKIIVSDKYE